VSRSRKDERSREMTLSQFLAAVPQKNSAIKVEPAGDGLLVSVPIPRPRWLVPPISWILPFSDHRRVELDGPGKTVLELCDGQRTVEEVVESFAQRHKLSFRESQLAVTKFFRELVQRGIMVIVGNEED
jgi:hypothetical protein